MPRLPIAETSLPPDSALHARRVPGDFLDSYAIDGGGDLPLPAILERVLRLPGWVVALLVVRNLVVWPFGLKTGDGIDSTRKRDPKPGDVLSIFPVHSIGDDEAILGDDDRHLDYRVSVMRFATPSRVVVSTWVRPHNWLGRAYLALVLPFHRVIVPRMLRNVSDRRRGLPGRASEG
jgi:hypothetical protein